MYILKYETPWLRPIATLAKDHPQLQSSKFDNSQLHVNLGIEGAMSSGFHVQ